jgi:hypothetical protein
MENRFTAFAIDLAGLSVFVLVLMWMVAYAPPSRALAPALLCLSFCSLAWLFSAFHSMAGAHGGSHFAFLAMLICLLLAAVAGFVAVFVRVFA